MEFQYEKNRIYIEKDNKIIAEITFPQVYANTVNINHTFVDSSLRGQGVAGSLMQEAVKIIEENHMKVIPTCSYAVKWFEKHPEYTKLIAKN